MATEALSYEELNSLPCLDAIVRETLRTYPVAPGIFRTAAEDTMLPLSKPYVDKEGNKQNSLLCVKAKQPCAASFAESAYNSC